jgi:hypothetical protein
MTKSSGAVRAVIREAGIGLPEIPDEVLAVAMGGTDPDPKTGGEDPNAGCGIDPNGG